MHAPLAVVPALLHACSSLGYRRIRAARPDRRLRIIVSERLAPTEGVAGDQRPRRCSATSSTTSTARPRSRWATIATPADCAPAPGCAGRPPLGTTVASSTSTASRYRRPDRPDLRGQRHGVRRLHRRRQQGDDRRPHVHRRRRPPRRRRAALRRRPRRRDDRLGRRERVPREVEELLAAHPPSWRRPPSASPTTSSGSD